MTDRSVDQSSGDRLREVAREAVDALDAAAQTIRREFGDRDPLEPWAEAEAARDRLREALDDA